MLDDEILTIHVASLLGEAALDVMVATTRTGLKYGSSYLAYWNVFLACQQSGIERYDIGGIDLKNNPSVYQFKAGMGGEKVFHVGVFDACNSLYARIVWRIVEGVYNLVKK